jgi:dihydroorotate dehydrogenase (NAD+) catalytic subunit
VLAGVLSAEEGVAALEVNVSCPNVREGGAAFGQDARAVARVTEAVKRRSGSKPVIVKLSPNVTDIADMARAAESAGADAISAVNTLLAWPWTCVRATPGLASGGGSRARPSSPWPCLRVQCARRGIPVIGLGGITTAETPWSTSGGALAVQVARPNSCVRTTASVWPGLPQSLTALV